mgnify:FL=1
MKKTIKTLAVLLVVLLVAINSVAACTIFAVGRLASADGSTMISHTCDSNSDDVRIWLIPSMEEGSERDVVLSGRKGADYSQFPEVKDYGVNGMVLSSYVNEKATNQYIHGMYSFMNDKGLAMGESTCSRVRSGAQADLLKAFYGQTEGIWDCYMLQDAALENCSTASEAVDFMGKKVEEEGWSGAAECINITDGTDTWIFEVYGGNVWVAMRVPENAVFVAANRARIDYLVENDPSVCRYSKNIKEVALANGLWDGVSEFQPNNVFAPNKEDNMGCTLREWRAITLLNPEEYSSLDPFGDPDEYPLFVVPSSPVSVDTIHKLSSDYYQGTQFDLSRSVDSGDFGNPLSNYNNSLKKATKEGVARPINMFRCTYIQIANVKAWLPEEARCLVWLGWGAPSTTYLTPVFASQLSLPEFFGRGVRGEFDENSGFWNTVLVQQLATINYNSAIEDIKAARDEKMAKIYKSTAIAQEVASSMIEVGQKDKAVKYLTTYASEVANSWFDTYKELANLLKAKYMFGNVSMKVPARSDWWKNIVFDSISNNMKPEN